MTPPRLSGLAGASQHRAAEMDLCGVRRTCGRRAALPLRSGSMGMAARTYREGAAPSSPPAQRPRRRGPPRRAQRRRSSCRCARPPPMMSSCGVIAAALGRRDRGLSRRGIGFVRPMDCIAGWPEPRPVRPADAAVTQVRRVHGLSGADEAPNLVPIAFQRQGARCAAAATRTTAPVGSSLRQSKTLPGLILRRLSTPDVSPRAAIVYGGSPPHARVQVAEIPSRPDLKPRAKRSPTCSVPPVDLVDWGAYDPRPPLPSPMRLRLLARVEESGTRCPFHGRWPSTNLQNSRASPPLPCAASCPRRRGRVRTLARPRRVGRRQMEARHVVGDLGGARLPSSRMRTSDRHQPCKDSDAGRRR